MRIHLLRDLILDRSQVSDMQLNPMLSLRLLKAQHDNEKISKHILVHTRSDSGRVKWLERQVGTGVSDGT
jgi:hypothetical protein